MVRTGQWLHGFLDLCLLALLHEGPDYGFALAQRLSSAGLGEIPGGTLYPALVRLEQQGLVDVSWAASDTGPPRKYFSLNASGRAALRRDSARWAAFRDSMDIVVTPVTDGRR